MSMNNQFFLYARKSTDVEDKQVLSIEAQLAELRNYAKIEGLSIIEEIVEKQSAKSPGRPLFNAMMSKLEKGEGNGIISWNPDRLARNSVDGGKIIYLLDTGRISTLKFPTFWFESTPQGKFMLNIAFGQSKYYVDSLAENTKRGLRQKVRRGEYPSRAPFGYLNDSRTKTIHVHKKNSVILKQIFSTYAKGESRLEDIANYLAECRIKSRNSKRLHVSRITFLLRNPFYYGFFKYNGELYQGKHQPLISKQLFDQVQEQLDRKGRPHHKTKWEPRVLCGLLHCSCGMMITGEEKVKHQKNGNEHRYTYYHCTHKSKRVKCSEPPIAEGELARQLSSLIKQTALPSDWADYFKSRLQADKKDSAQSVNAFERDTQGKIEVINSKLQRLLDGYLDQAVDQDTYKLEKNKLTSERVSLEQMITSLAQTQSGWIEPMEKWINQASSLIEVAECDDLLRKKVVSKEIFGEPPTFRERSERANCAPLGFFAGDQKFVQKQ
ncbi:recombinase family protein [Candidatus Microgenomates bacterium CPR3]|nr:recombinase family protein [Candidatus Microgenomates bacterium CPR3]